MNFTFETVAMEDLLDAAVQCGIHQRKPVCGLQECMHARKQVEAHRWLFINERRSGRRTVSASLCLYQFLLKDRDGRLEARENEKCLYIWVWEDIAGKCHTCHVT